MRICIISFLLIFYAFNAMSRQTRSKECLDKIKTTANLFFAVNGKSGEIDAAKKASFKTCTKLIVIDRKEQILPTLKKMKDKSLRIRSLIISGHSGSSADFFGKFRLYRKELVSYAIDFPELFNDVFSLHLWGCYTGNEGLFKSLKMSFPSAKLLVGFDAVAPGKDKVANHDLLYNTLVLEREIEKKMAINNVKSLLDGKMPDYGLISHLFPNLINSLGFAQFRASPTIYIETCNENYLYNVLDGEQGHSEVQQVDSFTICRDKNLVLKTFSEVNNFLENPKEELLFDHETKEGMDRDINILRYQYYPFLNKYRYCIDELKGYSFEAEKLLLFIFHKNIKKNFKRTHTSEIDEVRQITKGEVDLINIDSMSYTEINELTHKLEGMVGVDLVSSFSKTNSSLISDRLNDQISSQANGLNLTFRSRNTLLKMVRKLNNMVLKPSPTYVPPGWIE